MVTMPEIQGSSADMATGKTGAEAKPVEQLPDKPPQAVPGIVSRLRKYFLTGLVVTGPLAITLYLVWTLVNWVDGFVQPVIPVAYRPETYLPWKIPGSGLVIGVLVVTFVGFLTANLAGRTMVEAGESLLDRMPLVRSVYKALKQIFETLFSGSGTSFRRVGLVEFPAPGMWSLVFISSPASEEITERLPDQTEHISVFLPCTPNPTTGFYFYVARRDLIELDMSVEAAAKLIMSAGLIQPEKSDPQKGLASMAEAALAARAAQIPKNLAKDIAGDLPKTAAE
jgi:uncharacterized membrane protein